MCGVREVSMLMWVVILHSIPRCRNTWTKVSYSEGSGRYR